MKDLEINVMLQKAEELKALFVLGQRVIPFLEEIFLFIREIKPLLDEINHSISDNLQNMPKASMQLSKVTEATELATKEIMDILDGLVYKADVLGKDVAVITDKTHEDQSSIEDLRSLISASTMSDDDKSKAMKLLTDVLPAENAEAVRSNFETVLQSVQNDSMQIMMALQVQDITSQQLAAVNSLLEMVQNRLNQILSRFRNSEIGDLISTRATGQRPDTEKADGNVSTLHRDIAFDQDAIDALKPDREKPRQDDVDTIMEQYNTTGVVPDDDDSTAQEEETSVDVSEENATVSADDIDALFNSPDAEVAESTESPNGESEKKDDSDDDQTQFSQDDIDALFN